MMNYAASRATQNPAIPSNQNTAPILDFRCLYTHDLRKKKKKWHDGVLRFHTFNKRIMVYDIPMNFIGDTHWRSSEVVQDGDEIELDRGVLIQVGEATGIKEQDISEVFAKRRSAQESPQTIPAQRQLPPSVASVSAPLTQLRPKSLNELLGTPRGAYGRAALPAKSPFEERRPIRINEAEQARHAKRRRIDVSEDVPSLKQPPVQLRAKELDRNASLHRQQSLIAPETPVVPKSATHQVISIDPDDTEPMSSSYAKADTSSPLRSRTVPTRSNKVASRSTSTAAHRATTPEPNNSIPPAVRKQSLVPKPAISRKPDERMVVKRLTPALPVATKEAGLPLAPTLIPDRTPKFSRSKDNQPVNPLRVAPRKIRRKLMYRELLPKEYHEKPASINSEGPVNNIFEENTREKTQEPLDHKKNQSETLQSPSPSHQSQACAPEADHEESLFVSQDDFTLKDSAELARLDEAFLGRPHAPTIPLTPVPPDTTTTAPVLQGVRRSLLKFAMPTVPQAPVTILHGSTPEPSPQASTTLIPQSPPQSPRVPSSQPALDSPLSQSPQPAAPHSRYGTSNPGAKQNPPQLLSVLKPHTLQRPFQRVSSDIINTTAASSKRLLRRSESDITDRGAVAQAVQSPVQEKGNNTGPWSREAFDLFGWRSGEPKRIWTG